MWSVHLPVLCVAVSKVYYADEDGCGTTDILFVSSQRSLQKRRNNLVLISGITTTTSWLLMWQDTDGR